VPARPDPSLPRLTLVAALLHLGFDQVTRLAAVTTPPYLQLRYMADIFQEMLSPAVVSVTASVVHGIISALFATALVDARTRRLRKIFVALSLAWILSGGLLLLVYVSAPMAVAAGSLVAGIPRALVVAFFLERALPPPEVEEEAGDPAGPDRAEPDRE
jgi:hypothetical protein